MTDKFGRFVLRHRLPFLLAILAVTGYFLVNAAKVPMESPTIDLFPGDHEYVETFVDYKEIFGGAATVLVVVEVKEGTVWETAPLAKVRELTKAIELLPAINQYQVLSIAQRKVRSIQVDEMAGFTTTPLMWPEVPATKEDLATLERRLKSIPRYFGKLVSKDSKAALIVAGFYEKQFKPKETYDKLNALARQIETDDPNLRVSMIGRPVMLGYIMSNYTQLALLFGLTLLAMILVLALYFRDVRGVVIPMSTAILSAIWGIGILGVMGFNFDPLIIVVPFIISARAISHSVQLIKRFMEEYRGIRDAGDGPDDPRVEAAARTFNGVFKPGIVGIITDAAGLAVVIVTPIPLMQKLAIMGSYWVASMVVTDLLWNPIVLSYFPKPTKLDEKEGALDRALAAVGYMAAGKHRWTVVGVAAGVMVLGVFGASRLVIGDVNPGTPMLWPDSDYNQDTKRIGDRFGNTDMFNVIVEGLELKVLNGIETLIGTSNEMADLKTLLLSANPELLVNDFDALRRRDSLESIKMPDVLKNMENLQRHLETIPEVAGTMSIADLLPSIIGAMRGGDPKWELIPNDRRNSGFFLSMIFSSAEPGDLAGYVTNNAKHANIRVFLRDHKGETLRAVVDKSKAFIKAHPMQNARFRLAGGYGGLLAAVNEVVAWAQARITLLAFAMVFFFCAAAFRSFLAGGLFLVPLVFANYMTYAVMGFFEIGLDVNALPVVALGVGMGVDFGLYIVGRLQEEYKRCGDMTESIVVALKTAGKAEVFTASTMIAGIIFWAWSFLRFQAVMGALLVFWMLMSMIGGLIFLPTLIAIIRPKFIVGSTDAPKTAK